MGKGFVVLAVASMVWAGACGGAPVGTQLGVETMGTITFAPLLAGRPDGTIYVAATVTGTIEVGSDGTVTPSWLFTDTAASVFVRRLRADGSRDWTRAVGEADDGSVQAIAVQASGSDGSVFIARQRAVTKLSASGDHLWDVPCVRWRCDGQFFVSSLVATADGGAALIDGQNLLVRLGGDGSLKWTTTVGVFTPGCPVVPGRVAELPDGTVLAAGNIPVACESGFMARSDARILRFDVSGNSVGVWMPTSGGEESSVAISELGVGPDGSIVATGTYAGTVAFGPGRAFEAPAPAADIGSFALKMRPDFAPLRFAAYPRQFESMSPTADGGLLTFEYRGMVGHGQKVDPYLIKLDENLVLTASTRVGSRETELSDLTAAGDLFAVAGSHLVPEKWDTFLTRYRF